MKTNKINFNNQTFEVNIRSQADNSVLKEIFELGEYKDVEPIIKSAKAPIVDAGAQAGFFSLYCRALNPDVKIFAIEPDEKNLEILEDNFEINQISNIEIISAALAGKSGLRDFYISVDTHNHSLIKVLTPHISKIGKVKTYNLDDLLKERGIDQVSLLKLDIEGSEHDVLNKFTGWSKIKNIVLEYHDFAKFNHDQLIELLEKEGYKIKTTPSKFDQSLGFIIATK